MRGSFTQKAPTGLALPLGCLAVALACLPACGRGDETAGTLQKAFAEHFRVGVAIGTDVLMRLDEQALRLVARQYNSVTPENLLKWEKVHPEVDRYDFAASDRFVQFGERHGMFLVGHTLVWHSQTPDWVFQDAEGQPLTREALLARMREHIHAVVGRYRGRIEAWDVVNEALNDDGTLRDSPWRRIVGDDYLEHAFRFAAEADPDAELYYNDYGLHLAGKRDGAVALAQGLRSAGVRLDAIGMQAHLGIGGPGVEELGRSIRAFADAAGGVAITELDVNVLPWPDDFDGGAEVSRTAAHSARLDPFKQGLPPEMQRRLADRYAAVFRLFVEHRGAINRVTFWGIDDGRSWHNGWPIPGRTAHSLLFDRELRPKPAFHAVIGSADTPIAVP